MPPINSSEMQGGLQAVLTTLEVLGNTRRQAERSVFGSMQRQIGWLPFASIGIGLADRISQQHRRLEHALIAEARKALQPAPPPDTSAWGYEGFAEEYAPEREANVTGRVETQAPPTNSSPESTPVVRLRIPVGQDTLALPIAIHNHRDMPDAITMSVRSPAPHLAAFPVERLYFDPERLIISPHTSVSVQLILRLDGDLDLTREYWTEIVINGRELKLIALALQFDFGSIAEELSVAEDLPPTE